MLREPRTVGVAEEEFARWLQAASSVTGSPYEGQAAFEAFNRSAAQLAQHLPDRWRDELLAFASRRGSAALLLRGMTLQDSVLGATPAHWSAEAQAGRSTTQCEAFLLSVCSLVGEVFSFARQHGGTLIQNLIPLKSDELEAMGTGSKVFLDWHTEDAYDLNRADFIVILCVRGDEEAQTAISSLEAADLSSQTLMCLSQPRFRLGIDKSSGGSARPEEGPQLALTIQHPSWTEIRVDLDCVAAAPGDDLATAALGELRSRIGLAGNYVTLRQGDVLLIDNKRALHARSPFRPRYDGTDRWLQRVSVTRDLDASAPFRPSGGRVIDGAGCYA